MQPKHKYIGINKMVEQLPSIHIKDKGKVKCLLPTPTSPSYQFINDNDKEIEDIVKRLATSCNIHIDNAKENLENTTLRSLVGRLIERTESKTAELVLWKRKVMVLKQEEAELRKENKLLRENIKTNLNTSSVIYHPKEQMKKLQKENKELVESLSSLSKENTRLTKIYSKSENKRREAGDRMQQLFNKMKEHVIINQESFTDTHEKNTLEGIKTQNIQYKDGLIAIHNFVMRIPHIEQDGDDLRIDLSHRKISLKSDEEDEYMSNLLYREESIIKKPQKQPIITYVDYILSQLKQFVHNKIILENQICTLQKQLKEPTQTKRENKDLIHQYGLLCDMLEEKERYIENTTHKLRDVTDNLRQAEFEVHEKEEEINSILVQLQQSVSENDTLTQTIQEEEERYKILSQHLEASTLAHKQAELALDEQEEVIKALQKELSGYKEEKHIRQQLEEQLKCMQEDMCEMKDNMRYTNQEIIEVEKERDTIKLTLDTTRQQLKHLYASEKGKSQMTTELLHLQAKLSGTETDLLKLHSDITRACKERDVAVQKKTSLQSQLLNSVQSNRESSMALSGLQEEYSSLQEEQQLLRSFIQQYETELGKTEQQVHVLKEELEQAHTRTSSLEDLLAKMSANLTDRDTLEREYSSMVGTTV